MKGQCSEHGGRATEAGRLLFLNNNDNNGLNGNNNLNNNGRFFGIVTLILLGHFLFSYIYTMENALFARVCSYENLELAFRRARKGKTLKPYVIGFEKNLNENLLSLRQELQFQTYMPQPLRTFILRDPKTRKISVSDFRDRVIHHALCNIIEPIFEKSFIYDSYANRKFKGTLKAIQRYDEFKRKSTHNFTRRGFVFKADIKHYFEEVNHSILIDIIHKKIDDERMIWLIKTILNNYKGKKPKVGMPLGNLTSQFFANVYLDKLDQFVKHKLRVKYYIRYVDDFVILDLSKKKLEGYKTKIGIFLHKKLALQLHPDKSRIIPLQRGVEFLGLKIFPFYKQIKAKNLRKFRAKLEFLCRNYEKKSITYDTLYDFLEGWIAYTKHTNTYTLRRKIMAKIEQKFSGEISAKEINRHLKDKKSTLISPQLL